MVNQTTTTSSIHTILLINILESNSYQPIPFTSYFVQYVLRYSSLKCAYFVFWERPLPKRSTYYPEGESVEISELRYCNLNVPHSTLFAGPSKIGCHKVPTCTYLTGPPNWKPNTQLDFIEELKMAPSDLGFRNLVEFLANSISITRKS